MPRITEERFLQELKTVKDKTGLDLHLRGAGGNKLVLVEPVEPDLERRVSPELDRASMLIFLRAVSVGYSRGKSDAR